MINLTPTATKKARGPKPGSAMSSQSAKYAEGELAPKKPSPTAKSRANAPKPKPKPEPEPVKPPQRAIRELTGANRGQDTIAILHDMSVHTVTKYLGMDVKLAVGDNYDEKTREYEAALNADKVRRGKPNGPAVLAKGAEGEHHSARAAADSRKGQKPPAYKDASPRNKKLLAERAKAPAPKAALNKAPSAGQGRTYKVNKKANEAKADSWRAHMTAVITGSTSTTDAKAAHAKSGKFSANKLDFNWAAKNGFITFA